MQPAWRWRPGTATLPSSASPRRCALRPTGRSVEDVGLAAFGVGAAPVRLTEAEAQVRGVELTAQLAEQAGAASAVDVEEPTSDIHATSDYRRRALVELVRRALDGMAQSAHG